MSIAALLQAAEYLERRERGKFTPPTPPPCLPPLTPPPPPVADSSVVAAAAAAERVNTVVFFAEAEHGYASPMPITIDLKGPSKRLKSSKKSQGSRWVSRAFFSNYYFLPPNGDRSSLKTVKECSLAFGNDRPSMFFGVFDIWCSSKSQLNERVKYTVYLRGCGVRSPQGSHTGDTRHFYKTWSLSQFRVFLSKFNNMLLLLTFAV